MYILCVYTYIMCTHLCVSMCMYLCVCIYIYTHIYVYIYVCVCLCMSVGVLSCFSHAQLFETQRSLPDSSVHRILQASILKWVAMPSSRGTFVYVHVHTHTHTHTGFPGGSDSKESACQCRRPKFDPWVGKILWREGMAIHSSILCFLNNLLIF